MLAQLVSRGDDMSMSRWIAALVALWRQLTWPNAYRPHGYVARHFEGNHYLEVLTLARAPGSAPCVTTPLERSLSAINSAHELGVHI